jgi:hypothetical protein
MKNSEQLNITRKMILHFPLTGDVQMHDGTDQGCGQPVPMSPMPNPGGETWRPFHHCTPPNGRNDEGHGRGSMRKTALRGQGDSSQGCRVTRRGRTGSLSSSHAVAKDIIVERILEATQFRPTRGVIFRSPPYPPRRFVSAPHLAPAARARCENR